MIDYITAIGISLASLHIPHTDQRQFNPGIYVEIDNARLGYYRNSRDRNTFYVGYALPIYSQENIRVSVFGALASGYDAPFTGGLEFTIGKYLSVVGIPKLGKYNDANTLGFSLRIPHA